MTTFSRIMNPEIDGFTIPAHTHEALVGYILDGDDPGAGFLERVLFNDLKGAVTQADHENFIALPHIVKWLYNYAPGACWGSEPKVERWIDESKYESFRKLLTQKENKG
jgi:hypothetical protein